MINERKNKLLKLIAEYDVVTCTSDKFKFGDCQG
jgi:hypothetical protein